MKLIDLIPVMAKNWQFATDCVVIGAEHGEQLSELNPKLFTPFDRTQHVNAHVDILVHGDLHRRKDLKKAMSELASVNWDCAIIVIDEGTGSGRITNAKTKPVHRNDPFDFYVNALSRNFIKYDLVVHRYANCIVLSKGRAYYLLDDDTED